MIVAGVTSVDFAAGGDVVAAVEAAAETFVGLFVALVDFCFDFGDFAFVAFFFVFADFGFVDFAFTARFAFATAPR